jgi:glycine cleavage system aminomethyltransferase T
MKIAFAPEHRDTPAVGTPITVDGMDVGKITSAARSRHLGRVIALGYVQREHANAGTPVLVGAAPAVLDSPAS